ncbi:MAG: hypothetical protein JO254_03850 [Pseudolabrys sp.]|nr:hypothetical protein [Pseudolabrys sp.]
MKSYRDKSEGLAGSLVIYAVALAAVLVIVATPVYFLTGGVRYENPGMNAYTPPAGATLIRQDDPSKMQFSILSREGVVTPDQIAAISAKSKKAEKAPTHTARRETRQREVDARYATEPAERRSFFSFF